MNSRCKKEVASIDGMLERVLDRLDITAIACLLFLGSGAESCGGQGQERDKGG